MTNHTLSRFRDGIKAKRFTLQAAADASGIPYTTLADMVDADWGGRVIQTIDRLNALDEALNKLEGAR